MIRFIKHLPVRTMLKLLVGWVVLAIFNFGLISAGLNIDTPASFPISVFTGPTIDYVSLPYTLLFLIILFLAIKYNVRFSIFLVWTVGFILIVLGNLAQGGIDAAFFKPFYKSGYELYHDAIRITDWRDWLSNFNVNQPELFMHSKTHPPFAVLIHYFLLNIGSDKLLILAISFTLLSSLTIVLVWQIMKSCGLNAQQSSQFALLFSVIPAFNIYSAVSLDGVIAMLSTIFLLGVIKIIKGGDNLRGMFFFIAGILLTNLLTFGGTFLLATACLIAVREIIIDRHYSISISLFITLLLGILIYFIMLHYFGYDHIKAFHTAYVSENPNGFRALYMPLDYVMTRIENVAEIALFLSIGVLALLFHYNYLKIRIYNLYDNTTSIFLAGVSILFLMFLAGAYRTGETARACLFIYPYFFFVLRNLQQPLLQSLIIVAGLQTIIMQTFGRYLW